MPTEVLIIGGGTIGLSIARELKKRGVSDICVLDKGVAGSEASWAAAGMLSPQADAREDSPFFRLCSASRDLYPAWCAELESETGVDTGLRTEGTLSLAFTGEDAGELLRRFEWQQSIGQDVERLSAGEALEIEASISPEVLMALRFGRDWQIDSRRLHAALRRYAELNGIQIVENVEVTGLRRRGSRILGVQTPAAEIDAGLTIIAAGAWSSLIPLDAGAMAFRVTPVKGEIVSWNFETSLISHVIQTSFGYVLQRSSGRVLCGATSQAAGFDKDLTQDARSKLTTAAARIVPSLKHAQVYEQWSGLRPASSDELPILGNAGPDGLLIAAGHYRNGVLLAPITAQIIARCAVDGIGLHGIEPFSPTRFMKDQASGARV